MTFMKQTVFVFLTKFLFCLAKELPSFMHVCPRSDSNMEQCLTAAIEDIRPYLVTGVPEYNIPSLEPLVLKDLIKEEAAGMKIVTTNVTVYGCSDFFVRGIEIDKTAHSYIIHVDLPKLRIFADYSISGKLILIPVNGNGDLEANVTDCVSTTTMQGEIYEHNNDKYMKFVSNSLKVKVGGGHIKLANLFNGDKILLGVINDAVNKNLDPFLRELMPAIEKGLANVILDVANDLVGDFTFDQLFPE